MYETNVSVYRDVRIFISGRMCICIYIFFFKSCPPSIIEIDFVPCKSNFNF